MNAFRQKKQSNSSCPWSASSSKGSRSSHMISAADRVSGRSGLLDTPIGLLFLCSLCSWSNGTLAADVKSGDAHTSAEALLHACVYKSVQPDAPVTYTFRTQALQCMSKTVTAPTTLSVSNAGVTCVLLGDVSQKGWTTGGDNCYGYNSGLMLLSYSGGEQGSESGSVKTDWWTYLTGNNHMRLEDSTSAATRVCFNSDQCKTTEVNWPWANSPTLDLYIIFDPAAASTPSNLNSAPVDRNRELPK
jgi:hypothetical protein